MTAPLLEVRGLTKAFGGLVAVNDMSFSIAPGEVLGLIGPNGSGKTTLLNLVAGTIRADGMRMCAHLSGLPITPCFRVQRIDDNSFRGSISGLDFAYCNFNQHTQRSTPVASN